MARWRGALLAAIVAAAGTAAVPVPADAATAGGACTDPEGITVIVDLTHFDGGIQVRCAPGPVSSGFDALRRAGFEVTGTRQFPALLCRIDGLPDTDPCVNPPPSGAYWAYWHAPRGGDWTYSTSGATRRPPLGSVEGWAFGAQAEPGIDPPAAIPPSPTTTRPRSTTTAPPTPPADSASGGTGSGAGPSTTAASATAPPETTTTTTAERGQVAGSPDDRDGGGGAGGDALGDPAATATPRNDDGGGAGSPLAAIVTVGLLVAVVAGGILRRRSAPPRGGIGELG